MTKTITMPLEEYEQMQQKIESLKKDLKKRDVRNFIKWDWPNSEHQEIEVWVDHKSIRDYIEEDVRYRGMTFVEKNPERFAEKLHTGETLLTKKQIEEIKNLPLGVISDKPMNITINCTCNHKSPKEMAQELVKNIQDEMKKGTFR